MADEKAGRFPDPHEFQVPPELEGWEEMYPSHYLFSKDREDWEKISSGMRTRYTRRSPCLPWT